jgi:CheY-like chemotaxis protein
MNRQGRILVIDDEARWRDELRSQLCRAGYIVESAGSVSSALQMLQESFYHLLVLDIRMVDGDKGNVEGMQLLDLLATMDYLGAVEIIMLSAYGTKAQMRAAFRRYRVADFQSKTDFSAREFTEMVRQTFEEKIKVNLDLQIEWASQGDARRVVDNLVIAEQRVKNDPCLEAKVELELDDLLCRLFYNARSLWVRPMAQGRSGAGVLEVQPFYDSGPGEAVVVKFGDFRLIDKEHHNYEEYVKPFVGGGRHTTITATRRTPMLGGVVYSLLGREKESFFAFSNFYQSANIADIRAVIDELFARTCGLWYQNASSVQLRNLTEEYELLLNCSVDKLRAALTERLDTVHGKERLHFAALPSERSFINPIEAIADRALIYPTCEAITHGDMNDTNFLVDADQHVWMIDFLRTGPGHILRDVAELESVVRIQLLAAQEATLAERLLLERTLAQCERFSQVPSLASQLPTENGSLAKAFLTCVHLRTVAQRLVATRCPDRMDDYWAALLFFALNLIRFYGLPKVQREHALLSASIYAELLGLQAPHG